MTHSPFVFFKYILVIFSVSYLATFTVQAQEKIDSLTTNLNKVALNSEGDSVRLELGYRIKNPKDVEYLKVRFGTTNGGAEVFECYLQVIQHQQKQYIKYDDTIMPITGNKSAFLKMIPKKYITASNYLTIIGKESTSTKETVFYQKKLK
ncbi:hypothetical protein QNI16_36555 [Cytophagaceae bacterium YF14B1]|uniref:Uncharacterized protein n=1 Tax=Xanthocytophaga flava TaxID=3048013 RepID=A0AAE3QW26_9BACT|nr:hypothetical protein [Xanthocytophaga flavus]MDJ1486051.1 hypothetical protein [Xanthocytophaga flavus]